MMNAKLRRRTVMLGGLSALAMAAKQARSADAPAPATIRQGVFTGSGLPAIFAGVQEGYFKQEGISLQLQFFGNGPAMISALLGNSLDITHADMLSWGSALAGGQKISFITPASQAETPDGDVKSSSRLAVLASSGITKPGDLVGKRIGVGASQLSKVTVAFWLDKQGVDPKSVDYEIVAQPASLLSLLKTGAVAAAAISDPGVEQLQTEVPVTVLGWPFEVVPRDATFTGLFSTTAYAGNNPQLLRRYVRAYRRGAVYFNKATQEERAHLLRQADVDLDALAHKIPGLVEAFKYNRASDKPSNIAATQGWIDIGVKYGGVPKHVDIAPFVFATATEEIS